MNQQRVIAYLKQNGPATLRRLRTDLALTETTARHHLNRLMRDGLVEIDGEETADVGRPAALYASTRRAEGLFPKRYAELLGFVLAAAERSGTMHALFDEVADEIAAALRAKLAGKSGDDAVRALLDGVDYGDMLGSVVPVAGGYEMHAYNCHYHAMGLRYLGVCELLPTAISRTGVFTAERLDCQRDGLRSCNFFIAPANGARCDERTASERRSR
jgi:predicted ArsR family transcriptional regulator